MSQKKWNVVIWICVGAIALVAIVTAIVTLVIGLSKKEEVDVSGELL